MPIPEATGVSEPPGQGLRGTVAGNTSEPHLHIHAQRPAESGDFLSGEPLPITLNGRFLARNDDRIH